MNDQQLYLAIGIPLVVALCNTGLLVWILGELRDIRKETAKISERVAVLEDREVRLVKP